MLSCPATYCNVKGSVVAAQFEFRMLQSVIPKSPRSYQRAEGSPVAHSVVAGDPSLRLKNGCAQDDAIDERRSTRIRALSGLGQKSMTQSVQAGTG